MVWGFRAIWNEQGLNSSEMGFFLYFFIFMGSRGSTLDTCASPGGHVSFQGWTCIKAPGLLSPRIRPRSLIRGGGRLPGARLLNTQEFISNSL